MSETTQAQSARPDRESARNRATYAAERGGGGAEISVRGLGRHSFVSRPASRAITRFAPVFAVTGSAVSAIGWLVSTQRLDGDGVVSDRVAYA
jgi:hypothetical protein